MGYKIHVAEEYQVRHNSSDAFNNRSAEINRMLHENCPNLSWSGEDVECSDRLKVPRSELADLNSVAEMNLDKIKDRLSRGTLHGSGDNR